MTIPKHRDEILYCYITKLGGECFDPALGNIMTPDTFDNRIIRVHGKENWNPKTTVARGLPMNDVLYQELFIQSISKKSRWVFCDERGEQLKEVNTLRVLKHVVSELKISYGTLHMFRHSTATHMLKAGVSLKDVKEFLGHKDIETTEQYLHLLPNSLHDAAQKLHEICTIGYH